MFATLKQIAANQRNAWDAVYELLEQNKDLQNINAKAYMNFMDCFKQTLYDKSVIVEIDNMGNRHLSISTDDMTVVENYYNLYRRCVRSADFLSFSWGLSSGEALLLNQFGKLLKLLRKDERNNYYLTIPIDEEEILLYTFGFDSLNKNDVIFGEKLYGDKFYVAYSGKILYPHANIDHELVLNDVMSGKKRFKDYFSVDQSRMIYAFICILIVYNCCPYNDLEDILALEDLVEGHDKYGLTDVTSAQFLRQGLLIDNKYYLYNILFDTSIASPGIVKKCAVREYPKSVMDRYQAAW